MNVNFAATRSAPTYRAAGWIYGMTEDGTAPPDHFLTDIKYQAMRAGGAQLAGGGWVAVETIIDESVVREIIPQLKALGAEGIIEYPLNKVVH
jgi:ATP phosphoribosyltransferase